MGDFKDYNQVLDFLYTQLPMFQRVGGVAFRKDLTNTVKLCDFLKHPQHRFKSVHIAGTNGKGSSAHMIASILESAGYRTGLYTSPHLKDFTERVRLNGQPVAQAFVVDFVNRIQPMIGELSPSFFEITVALAFDFFAQEQVDIAVIEVGMGGRLDSTNVILPEVSLITNISMDHSQWLGDTLEKIASEKAGIIKEYIPAVISETQDEITSVFNVKAAECDAEIFYADDTYQAQWQNELLNIQEAGVDFLSVSLDLGGKYQEKNIPGVLKTIDVLNERGFDIEEEAIIAGLENVITTTGLKGRWQIMRESPKVICDVGHNEAGVQHILEQLEGLQYKQLYIIWGTVADKDVGKILSLLPESAYYYYCQPKMPRALQAGELAEKAMEKGLRGEIAEDVNMAVRLALERANSDDLIFVGGSTFVVAELEDL